MLTARSDERVLGRPCEVHFAGFRSDTYRLQQAGWKLSMEQDIMRRTIRLAMRYEPADLYMVAESTEYDFMRDMGYGQRDPLPVFQIRYCSSRMVVQMMGDFSAFRPIDATPSFVTSERKSIEDFNLFAPLQTRTQEILVEPESVQECLDLIKRLQAPELQAVRKRNEQRSRDAGCTEYGSMAPRTNLHAQIITLAA